jgi:signal transduction histidine kinase
MSLFMGMAVHRCLDFAKASNGITLIPKMETIDLQEVLVVPVDCINHLQSDSVIVVRPIPPEICQFIITDKHWLIQNILCLLSNATKYSNCGEVSLILELDFQTHEFLSHKILKVTVEDAGIGEH